MMKISIYGKELYLIDNGVDLKSSRPEVVELLLQEAKRLNSISHKLTNNLIIEEIKERLFHNTLEYYEYKDRIFMPIPYTLMNVLNEYVIHAVELAGVETISFETPSFLELFVNGYGRPRFEINKIAYEIATDLEEIVDSRYQTIYYVLLGSIIAILFSVAFLKILPLYKFQQLRKDTWEHIFSIPMSTLILGLQQSRDRLFTVHGVEMNSSDVNANIQRKCSYKVDRKQIRLYMIVVLLVTGVGMYIFSVYWKLAPDRSQLLKDTINTNLYLKLKQSATWFNLFVIREKADMVQDSQDYIKGDLSLEAAIKELNDIHYKSLEYDDVTDQIWDIYYNSYNSYQYGYHSYTNYLTGKIHEIGLLISEGSKYLNIGGQELESEIKNYITATRDMTQIYSKEFESLRKKYFNDFLGISIVVSIGTAMVLLFIFKPLANNFKQQIEREIEILKYLPIYENIQ